MSRPPGRPRSEAIDRAILEATVELLARDGYGALSIERVAAAAGVGRPTIYRRHASRAELVVAAVSAAFDIANPEIPDTGSCREDTRILLENTIRMLRDTPIGDVIRALVPEIGRDEELARLAGRLDRSRRRLLRGAIRRGVERGEIDKNLRLGLATDALLGAIYLRLLVTGQPIPNRLARDLVQLVLGA